MGAQEKDTDSRYRAPALDKGLDILEHLAAEPSGLTRAEIVRSMNKSPSEIYRMLERLVARGYVARSLEGDRYALSLKLFSLGTNHPPLRRLRTLSQPLMDKFAEDTLQSVHLAALDRGSAVVIAQASSPANWEFRLRIGSQLDLFETSSGTTLLAFQDEESLGDLLDHATIDGQPMSPRQIVAKKTQLAKIREAGQRTSDSKQLMGVTDISVPVLDNRHNGIAVLTSPYIKRIDEKHTQRKHANINQTLKALRVLAENISIQ